MLGIDGSELGGCRLIRKIGAGAMGEVYLAEQVALGNRLVAVKVVHAERDVTPAPDAAEDAEWHFIREAQVLGRLTHPNILPVYHSGVEAGYLFLVMQYAPDGSLADAIKGKGAHVLNLPASPTFVADIITQLAGALQYTHEHHVIHADVKPSNVLVQVEPNGHWHVLLADFGIARSMDSLALRDEVAGTAAYMAPEQFFGQLSPACDQYALGVVAYQLLSGRLPFTGGLVELVNAHAREAPPTLRSLNPAVSAGVEAAIMRALAKQPEDRHHSAADFSQALRGASTGAHTTVLAAGDPGADWGGVGPASNRRDRTARTAPAATWIEPPQRTLAETLVTPAIEPPATRSPRDGNARRRIAPGLAVLALLLVSGIAGLGLRSHIDLIHAFSSLGGSATTPTVPATSVGQSPTPSPTTAPSAPGSPGDPGGPIIWPAPTPTAQPTAQSTPAATATPAGEPSATAIPSATDTPTPSVAPTASATAAPSPAASPTATAAPQPSTTAPARPTQPAPTTAPRADATTAPSTPHGVQPAPEPNLPVSVPGA